MAAIAAPPELRLSGFNEVSKIGVQKKSFWNSQRKLILDFSEKSLKSLKNVS